MNRLFLNLFVVLFAIGHVLSASDEAILPPPKEPTLQSSSVSLSTKLNFSVEPSYGLNSQSLTMLVVDSSSGSNQPKALIINTKNSFMVLPVTFEYQSTQNDSFTLSIPYIRRNQSTDIAGIKTKSQNDGLGDTDISYEHQFYLTSLYPWAGNLNFQLQAPTGNYSAELPLGNGYYVVSGAIGLQKIADPLVVMASVGLNYSIPKTIGGVRYNSGIGYTLQTGIGYSLNDRMVLVEQLEYLRSTNIFLEGDGAASTNVDQAYISHSLTCNSGKNTTLRIKFSLGLNDVSNQYIISTMWQRNF